jgi:multimeric flavodoxin WrbA
LDIVVLDGARVNDRRVDEVSEVLQSALQSVGDVSAYKLRDLKIADCIACFGCWVKTPGQCVIDDPAREIAVKLAQCDLLVYLTPVVFGGYSYELKKALDRQICTLLPFMKKFNGELHHPQRYEKKHKITALGVLVSADPLSEATFKTLLYRNSLNWQTTHQTTAIIYDTDNAETTKTKIDSMLMELEVKR